MLDTLLFFYLVVPLVHLIHEAGHVCMAKLHKVKNTEIGIGVGPKIFDFYFKGTKIQLNIIPFLGGYSSNDQAGKLSHKEIALISFGGPLFTLLSIVFFLPFWTPFQFSFSALFVYFSLWIGIVNLIPFKIGEKQSDGWQIASSLIQLVKNR